MDIPSTMFVAGAIMFVAGAIIVAFTFGRRWRGISPSGTPIEDPINGVSIEVDCRACGQFNRVPGERLRDRPNCGRCKSRLMPGRRVAITWVKPIEGSLRSELNACWNDEDRLWQSLANHVTLQDKARREEKDPSLRTVN